MGLSYVLCLFRYVVPTLATHLTVAVCCLQWSMTAYRVLSVLQPKQKATTTTTTATNGITNSASGRGGPRPRVPLCLVEFRPITGRTHQLRIHAAQALNTPILGDKRYADATAKQNATTIDTVGTIGTGMTRTLDAFGAPVGAKTPSKQQQRGKDNKTGHGTLLHLHAHRIFLPAVPAFLPDKTTVTSQLQLVPHAAFSSYPFISFKPQSTSLPTPPSAAASSDDASTYVVITAPVPAHFQATLNNYQMTDTAFTLTEHIGSHDVGAREVKQHQSHAQKLQQRRITSKMMWGSLKTQKRLQSSNHKQC